MASSRASTIAIATVGTAAALFTGYAVYFDYQRRHNAKFRKSLQLEKKKIQAAEEAERKALALRVAKELAAGIKEIASEPIPQTEEQREAYFTSAVAQGETLATSGPENHVKAALQFFRALRVYPEPTQLLTIYQKICPAPVFLYIIEAAHIAESAATAANPSPADLFAQLMGGQTLGGAATRGGSLADIDDGALTGTGLTAAEIIGSEADDEDDSDDDGVGGEDDERTMRGAAGRTTGSLASPTGSGTGSGTSAEWEDVAA